MATGRPFVDWSLGREAGRRFNSPQRKVSFLDGVPGRVFASKPRERHHWAKRGSGSPVSASGWRGGAVADCVEPRNRLVMVSEHLTVAIGLGPSLGIQGPRPD